MAEGPELATPRTALRPLGPADLSSTHALWLDPDVRRYLWDDRLIDDREAAAVLAASREHFAAHGYGLWAVREPRSGEQMGVCGLRPADAGVPEFLFAFWPRYWGRGLAHEAGRAVLAYAFDVLGRDEVVAATDVPNRASARALERLGLRRVGRGLLNGLDTYFYRIERDEFGSSRVR